MARANLGNLLSVANDQGTVPEAPPKPTPEAPKTARKASGPSAPVRATNRAAKAAKGATHWTEYERLEARLRDEQVEQLDRLVRRLNKRRGGVGERITKNSLLRIATDLLLDRQDALAGYTEEEIRASLRN